jgi:hypothetical protein
MKNLKEIEKKLLDHCYTMGILKLNAEIKKKDAVLDNLIAAVVRSEMTIDELTQFIVDVNDNKVFDITFFEKFGNIENYINSNYKKFMKALWRQRSTGLGTPNAASGEGELMFVFSSSLINKASKGDLVIDNKIKELKGEQARVDAKLSGKDFRKKTLEVCSKYNLTPISLRLKVKFKRLKLKSLVI